MLRNVKFSLHIVQQSVFLGERKGLNVYTKSAKLNVFTCGLPRTLFKCNKGIPYSESNRKQAHF